jgi:hypothetical protein
MRRRVLWVATKPPWPALDGGRLLVALTLRALAARGIDVTFVAPCPPAAHAELTARLRGLCRPRLVPVRPGARDVARAWGRGLPLAIARHAAGAVQREVARLVAAGGIDVVHAEQLQALPQCVPARAAGLPVVLRAQNVESDLWARRAAVRPLAAPLLRPAAARLARWEGAAVCEAAATIALSARDGARLRALAGGGGSVRHVAAPFAGSLPPGPPLAGDPAVVLFGSGGWFPNRDGARWFVRRVWPRVRAQLPGAVLHVFGLPGDAPAARVVAHGAPPDSRTAFADGAVLAVPLRVASGIRMKILEAWARGVPVVATAEAVAGLDAAPGRELLVAGDADAFAAAVAALHRDPAARAGLAAAGRAALAERYRPDAAAKALLALYEAVT